MGGGRFPEKEAAVENSFITPLNFTTLLPFVTYKPSDTNLQICSGNKNYHTTNFIAKFSFCNFPKPKNKQRLETLWFSGNVSKCFTLTIELLQFHISEWSLYTYLPYIHISFRSDAELA